MTRRWLLIAWSLSLLAGILLTLDPVSSRATRLGWLMTIAVFAALTWILWPRPRFVRAALVLGVAAPVVLLMLPGRPFSKASLRSSAIDALREFEGTPYVWGGEGLRGVDCSGLVRQALLRASMREGLSSLNGDLLRQAASLWWFDASARSLRDGFRGETAVLMQAAATNAVPVDDLLPGDFVVTAGGVHVLAYLGGRRWIEADPDLGGVVVVETPSANPWFEVPVHVLRWRALDE